MNNRSTQRAFTLIEMVVSMIVMSVLVTAMASAIVLAAKAMPTGEEAPELTVRVADAISLIREEIGQAIYISEQSATAITFVVADQTGDGKPEVIRYAWSGVSGGPLRRTINGSSAVEVIDSVISFELGYTTTNHSSYLTPPTIELDEQELFSHVTADDFHNYDVKHDKWWGQHLEPNLPADAVAWRISRVQFRAKDHGDPLDMTIELATALADMRPSSEILDQTTLPTGILPDDYAWQQVQFDAAHNIPATDGICVVFRADDGDIAKLEGQDKEVFRPGNALTEGKPGEWKTLKTDESLTLKVFGHPQVSTTPETITRSHTQIVQLSLQASGLSNPLSDTIIMLNQPPVVTGYWEADFSADPTTIDINGDSSSDWRMNTGTFDTAQLIDGNWQMGTQSLRSNPNNTLNVPTTVYLRMRDTTSDGGGPIFRMYRDRTLTAHARIEVQVNRESDGSQTLTVSHLQGLLLTSMVPLITITDLPDEMLDIQLLVNSSTNNIGLYVNNRHRGTRSYGVVLLSLNLTHVIEIDQASGGGVVDHVRMLMGGTTP